MFHGDIFLISYRKYIKTKFLISNMHCYELHLDKFEGDFLNIRVFLHPQNPDSCISAKYCPVHTNHTSMDRWISQLSDYV